MSTQRTGSIQFNYEHRIETVVLAQAPSLEHLAAFLSVFKQYTYAGVRKYAATTAVYLNESGEIQTGQNIEETLMVVLEYLDDDRIRRTFTLPIPVPKRSLLTFEEGRGYRLPESEGDKIALAYTQLTGVTHTFRDGWIIA